jgi:hypothetical protein
MNLEQFFLMHNMYNTLNNLFIIRSKTIQEYNRNRNVNC